MSFRTPPNPNAVAAFESFFQGWLVRQEHYLDELLSSQQNSHESHDSDLTELISRVLSHYQHYYEEKSKLANCDVFLVFSPTWFTPFERTFFWIAGFKPALTFRLVNNAVTDLTDEQKRRLGVLVSETKAEERELGEELARIQESVAAPPIAELVRREGRGGLRDGEVDDAGEVFEALRAAMEGVVGRADLLRTRTAEKVVEVLSPVQNVRFLTAATQLQQRIRVWGLQKEEGRRGSSGSGWY
ncbi:hypothetical protein Vadar_012503 [Vaccinium darrowii]|uniref:Uncharacterized protein n=1 Tax=Vaccinium darrowii TaxID=229202 RepID=A0ACB7XQ54_9ERIC|nr:hypothetical protein Vadar_012503 [Vaccinium darrowii]